MERPGRTESQNFSYTHMYMYTHTGVNCIAYVTLEATTRVCLECVHSEQLG